jgi:Ca2+-binding RTX toxin-like protein
VSVTWKVGINSLGLTEYVDSNNVLTRWAVLQLFVDGGYDPFPEPAPGTVQVIWGSNGIDGTEPDPMLYVFSGGPRLLSDGGRYYSDGAYTVRVTGEFPSGAPVLRLVDLFVAVSSDAGVERIGTGRIDGMVGGSGGDTLMGAGGDDYIDGAERSDLLVGSNGNDTLFGGLDGGLDTLLGGAGNDLLDAHDGNDHLSGGTGNDSVHGGAGNDGLLGQDGDDLLEGGSGDDRLVGGLGNDMLYGDHVSPFLGVTYGNDTILGNEGNDALYGGEGFDKLDGGSGDDYLWADQDDDTLIGGDGHDMLYGREGNDHLVGGTGRDVFDGGPGNDTFYSDADGEEDTFFLNDAGQGVDHIARFEAGIDKIHIWFAYGVGAQFATSASAVTGGGVWVIYDRTSGMLSVDMNGTGAGEAYDMALLYGRPALTAGDILGL